MVSFEFRRRPSENPLRFLDGVAFRVTECSVQSVASRVCSVVVVVVVVVVVSWVLLLFLLLHLEADEIVGQISEDFIVQSFPFRPGVCCCCWC